jgi:RimJ/RimL family protein N-acetyltransferase
MSPVVVLTTERLVLREFTADDAAFILELVNDPDWLRFIGDKNVHTIADAVAYLANGPLKMYREHGFGLWCVVLRATGTPVGMCGLLKRPTLPEVDIGFAFLASHRGYGYAHEAAAATVTHARRTLGLPRLAALTALENPRSIRLLEKLGLQFERILRLSPDAPESRFFSIDFSAKPSAP